MLGQTGKEKSGFGWIWRHWDKGEAGLSSGDVAAAHVPCPEKLLCLFLSHEQPILPRNGFWALHQEVAKCKDDPKEMRLKRCNPPKKHHLSIASLVKCLL